MESVVFGPFLSYMWCITCILNVMKIISRQNVDGKFKIGTLKFFFILTIKTMMVVNIQGGRKKIKVKFKILTEFREK